MNLMLLCAGEGTRLRPHTLRRPKPEIPFLTVPLAAYSLNWAAEVSPVRLIVNTYHLPARVHDLFHKLPHGIPDLKFSDEAPTLMGSGGGIKQAQSLLGDQDFLVMNGDEVFLPNLGGQLAQAREHHLVSGAIATLVVMNYPGVGTQFGGVWTQGDSRVLGFGKEKPDKASQGWHFIGAMFLSPRVFKYLPSGQPSNILYDGLVAALAAGESVEAFQVHGWWHETGNEVDYLKATGVALRILTDGESDGARFLETVLKKNRPFAELRTTGSHVQLLASAASKVPAGSEGFIVLGENAVLAPGENKNAVLGDGVHANQVIQNKLIV